MHTQHSDLRRALRIRPLAASFAIALANQLALGEALAPSAAMAVGDVPNRPTSIFLVQNCDDAGPGSLRDAVDAANMVGTDSTIEFDLATMGCSKITLTTGEIDITAPSITIGSGPGTVTIDGGYSLGYTNRIFNDTAVQGTLHLNHLVLTDAKYMSAAMQQARGGCVYAKGTADLVHTHLEGCAVIATNAPAYGGAVWGDGVKLLASVISNSKALSTTSPTGGGGLFANALGVQADYSTISGNVASSYAPYGFGLGGGVATRGPSTFQRSTISDNTATDGGGLSGTYGVAFANSTVANNRATRFAGAMDVQDLVSLYSTTVAFNEADENMHVAGVVAASVYAVSALIADNMTRSANGVVESDVWSHNGRVNGSHNLILTAVNATTLPMDTLSGCPRITALLNNGGPTRTIALLPRSPAIDSGYNPYDYTDQRGAGFDRVVGANVDIGAYEWSSDSGEEINATGFELCE